MNKESILNALLNASDEERAEIAEAIEKAYDLLREVRTGEDFECECWDGARGLAKSLGLHEEE